MPKFEALRSLLEDVHIAHHIRGRIRLKLANDPPSVDISRVQAGGFQPLLDRIPGITAVQPNLLARSCTVHYDPAVIPQQAWTDLLAGADSDAAALLERILHDAYLEAGHAKL